MLGKPESISCIQSTSWWVCTTVIVRFYNTSDLHHQHNQECLLYKPGCDQETVISTRRRPFQAKQSR